MSSKKVKVDEMFEDSDIKDNELIEDEEDGLEVVIEDGDTTPQIKWTKWIKKLTIIKKL
mgnify:CR=1 FL=1